MIMRMIADDRCTFALCTTIETSCLLLPTCFKGLLLLYQFILEFIP